MRKLLLAATMLGALVGTANADAILTLTKVPDQTVGPQNLSNPCIIAGTTCQPQSDNIIGYNNFVNQGGKSDYNLWSTTPTSNSLPDGTKGAPYTVSALEQAAGGSSLVIAIDVDTTHASAENLFLFEVWDETNHVRLAHFGDGISANGTCIGCITGNGNGWADWTLGTLDLSGLAPGTLIDFHAHYDSASNGPESFFLVDAPAAVPGPIAGAGIPGLIAACGGLLALARRRRASAAAA